MEGSRGSVDEVGWEAAEEVIDCATTEEDGQ